MSAGTSVRHFRWDDMPIEKVKEGLGRRLVTGERMMLAHIYLDKGSVVPLHSHDNEQLTYVLEGALHFLARGGRGRRWSCAPERSCIFRRGCRTRRSRWKTRWTWMSSARPGRTGWTAPTRT